MERKFITLEGIDGSGKSTQMRLLASELRLKDFDVLTTMEPGGTPLGRRLRKAFLETEESVSAKAELLLFAADRAQHCDFLIRPALEQGKIVISDRFADATVAYQGAGRGFPKEIVDSVIALATDGLKPGLTLFFDLPVNSGIKTFRWNRKGNNRMDAEESAFYERVRNAYLEIAEREPDRCKIVSANMPPDEVHTAVLEIVMKFLEAGAAAV